MEPKFVEKEAFKVMGFSLRGNPMSEEKYMDHEGAWREFMKHYEKVKTFSTDNGYYGVYFGVKGEEEGMMELIAGMAVSNVENAPDGLVIREVPKAYYAVFESKLKTIAQTYNYIFQEWLPKSEYEHDDYYTKPNFEFYPPDYSPESPSLFIHIPINAK
jgi:AraC family transcriptional regulator